MDAIHTRGHKIFTYIYIFISSLWCRQNVALSSATQHAMPLELGRKRGTICLNTRSLCLPCCLRDTAWYTNTYFFNYENVDVHRRKTLEEVSGGRIRLRKVPQIGQKKSGHRGAGPVYLSVVGSNPNRGNKIFFSLCRKTKHVMFRHSTRNISEIQRKVGFSPLSTRFPCLSCYVRDLLYILYCTINKINK